jgi:hypothetical protein
MSDRKIVRLISPKGIASYPKLNEPDTKFKADGEYSVGLLVSPDEAKEFAAKVKEVVKEYYKEQCSLLKKKELKLADLPIKKETDKEGNDTGKVKIKFALAAKIKSRKSGQEWEQRPALFDSKNKPTTERIGGGSTLRIAADVFPWYTPSLGVGVSLRCKAVQVLELQAPGGPSNADSYGFTAEEEGYVSGGESLPNEVFGTKAEEPAGLGGDF